MDLSDSRKVSSQPWGGIITWLLESTETLRELNTEKVLSHHFVLLFLDLSSHPTTAGDVKLKNEQSIS
jgi:hypothetical protein